MTKPVWYVYIYFDPRDHDFEVACTDCETGRAELAKAQREAKDADTV